MRGRKIAVEGLHRRAETQRQLFGNFFRVEKNGGFSADFRIIMPQLQHSFTGDSFEKHTMYELREFCPDDVLIAKKCFQEDADLF